MLFQDEHHARAQQHALPDDGFGAVHRIDHQGNRRYDEPRYNSHATSAPIFRAIVFPNRAVDGYGRDRRQTTGRERVLFFHAAIQNCSYAAAEVGQPIALGKAGMTTLAAHHQQGPQAAPALRDYYSDAFRSGYRSTVRLLRSRGAAGDLAEEFAQAAWVRGWEKLDSLQHRSLVLAWVNTIALRLFRDHMRSRQRLSALGIELSAMQTEHRDIDVRAALDGCSKQDQELFRTYYVEGYTTEEIARREDRPVSTIRVRLFRLRKSVHSALSPEEAEQARHRARREQRLTAA